MNYTQLETYVLTQISNTNEEYTRVFHGRGGAFDNYEQLTIDAPADSFGHLAGNHSDSL